MQYRFPGILKPIGTLGLYREGGQYCKIIDRRAVNNSGHNELELPNWYLYSADFEPVSQICEAVLTIGFVMVARTETTMLKGRTEIKPQSMRSQIVASFRQKTDGIVMALFIDTSNRRVCDSRRR